MILFPTAALPGCGLGLTRCETIVYSDLYNLIYDSDTMRIKLGEKLGGHLSKDTCPLTHSYTRIRKKRGGRRERASGWEKKNKTSKKEETSDNIQRMKTYLGIVQRQCVSLV